MSDKPLELRIYKIWENGMDGNAYCSAFTSDQHPGYPVNVDMAVLTKRLTDSELVAEYWAAVAHFNKMQWNEEMLVQQDEPEWSEEVWERIAAPMNTLYRFATLPHYDEGES